MIMVPYLLVRLATILWHTCSCCIGQNSDALILHMSLILGPEPHSHLFHLLVSLLKETFGLTKSYGTHVFLLLNVRKLEYLPGVTIYCMKKLLPHPIFFSELWE